MKKNKMKHLNLKQLALMGVSLGLLGGSCSKADGKEMSPEMKSFYEELTPEAQKKFNQLDEEHKKAAMSVTKSDHACKSESACKGVRENAVEEQYNQQMKGKKKS